MYCHGLATTEWYFKEDLSSFYLRTFHIPLHKKWRFSLKDFFSKCDQIRRKLWIWSHLLKKPLMENFIFCVVTIFLLTISFFFFEKTDIFIFVDDNTIYKTNPNLSVELNSLDRSLTGVINWLKVNSLIADPAKTIIYGFRCKERFRI